MLANQYMDEVNIKWNSENSVTVCGHPKLPSKPGTPVLSIVIEPEPCKHVYQEDSTVCTICGS